MAITITQEPSNHTIPAHDPCIYLVNESSIGAYKFSYTLEVEVWDGSAYETVGTFRAAPNNEDAGVWDVGRIVQPYIPKVIPLETGSGDVIRDADSAVQMRLTFGSEQAVTATSAPVANASVRSAVVYFYNGSGRLGKSRYVYNDSLIFDLTSSLARHRALTSYDYPRGSTINFYVRDEDWGCMDFRYGETNGADTMRIRYYNGTTLLSTTNLTLATYAGGTSPGDNILRAYVYPDSLRAIGSPSTLDPDNVANAGWTKYRIDFRLGALTVSAAHDFHLITDCVNETPMRFMWQNEFGGWDFLHTAGRVTKKTNYDRQTYVTSRGNWYDASSSFTYGYSDRGAHSIPDDARESFTVHTGRIRDGQNSAIESLMKSRDVYATLADNPDTTDTMYPVHILTKSLTRLTSKFDDRVQYSFDFEYANQPTQVRL